MIYNKNLDDLGTIIEDDMRNDVPSELDSLSTHTYIDSVENIHISSKEIKSDIATVEGSGTVYVELQFGSDMDKRNGDGLTESMSFDFSFQIEIDLVKKIVISREYDIDTEKFYE